MFIPLSFVNCYRDHRALHSFPIRRSSDLDLTFTHEHLATLGDTLALSHATMSFTELAADDLTFGATVLERFLVIETSAEDRKSTRLNSSHLGISYAVFCLKKKKEPRTEHN